MATKRAFLCGCFVHVIQVFIESTVSSDELSCSSVVFSVGYKGSVEVIDNFCMIASRIIFDYSQLLKALNLMSPQRRREHLSCPFLENTTWQMLLPW